MSREIKFRGLDKNGIWRFGYYHAVHEAIQTYHYIRESSSDKRIDPVTLGQWTGLKDKNGKEIYEGDLLKFFDKVIAEVVFQELGGWSYKWLDDAYKRVRQKNPEPFFHNIMLWEVAGNVHQNKDLLPIETLKQ